jgi:hypothetical protein
VISTSLALGLIFGFVICKASGAVLRVFQKRCCLVAKEEPNKEEVGRESVEGGQVTIDLDMEEKAGRTRSRYEGMFTAPNDSSSEDEVMPLIKGQSNGRGKEALVITHEEPSSESDDEKIDLTA